MKEKDCFNCGKTYILTSINNASRQKFCSNSCANKYRWKNNNPVRKEICNFPQCSTVFEVSATCKKYCRAHQELLGKLSATKRTDLLHRREDAICSIPRCSTPATDFEDWPICYGHRKLAGKHNLSVEYLCLMHMAGCSIKSCPDQINEFNSLVIDHDHSCCSGDYSCGRCVRGGICSRCNKVLTLNRTTEYFEGLLSYLNRGEESRRIREGRLI